jgi:hypothetical protein
VTDRQHTPAKLPSIALMVAIAVALLALCAALSGPQPGVARECLDPCDVTGRPVLLPPGLRYCPV